MLTEERYQAILNLLDVQKAVTVTELTQLLDSSESTVRRDLAALASMGKLKKVHGGATAVTSVFTTQERGMAEKYALNTDDKRAIARAAAAMIKPKDFVYLDAGTTTEYLAEYLTMADATYVTNGIHLAKKLVHRGLNVYVPAGRIKARTEAIIGGEAADSLSRYHFSLGFFGANGINIAEGYTTPDIEEARVKTAAVNRCAAAFVLADPSKFNQIHPVSFAPLERAAIVTTSLPDPAFRARTQIIEVG